MRKEYREVNGNQARVIGAKRKSLKQHRGGGQGISARAQSHSQSGSKLGQASLQDIKEGAEMPAAISRQDVSLASGSARR